MAYWATTITGSAASHGAVSGGYVITIDGTAVAYAASQPAGVGFTFASASAVNFSYDPRGGTVAISGNAQILSYTISTTYYPTTYSITCQNDGHGTLTANKSSAAEGTTIKLTKSANSGYQFNKYETTPSSLSISSDKFTMPARAVTVKALFNKLYTITCQNDGHGTLTASKASAVQGTTITLTPTANTGYTLDHYTISPSATISNNKFTMPAGNVTVKAFFKATYTRVSTGNKIKATDRSQTGTATTVGNVISDSHFTAGESALASTFNDRVLS